MNETGKKISGRYLILGTIGSGGMANVFLARDLILNREVAVKVLRYDFQNDQDAIRRFRREALAATELVHPNIVAVYDVGEEDGMQYLVMEYVKGMDLKRYIQTHAPIAYMTIVDIMQQVLSAVSLAHQHRIIHRDLKPQNILINEDGIVKIADFGIAIALSETSITQTNTMLGSVHYVSPEQARGSMATDQSDIYALGIILYELLTGSVPFDGESAVTIALKHFQDEMPSLRAHDPNIPQSLENVVLRATAKDPSDRYASAEAMHQDLATVFLPNRLHEAPWQSQAVLVETKAMPIAEEQPTLTETVVEVPVEVAEVPKKKKKWKKWFAFFLLLVIGVLSAMGFSFLTGGKKEVTVPKLAGMSETQARQTLLDNGLKVADKTEEVPNDKIKQGKVVKTLPAADEIVKKNREVTLYISSGTKKVKLKDFSGYTLSEAREVLQAQGFNDSNIRIREMKSEEVSAGQIIKQTPAPATEVSPKDDEIVLTVSTGPETIIMQDYRHSVYDDAVSELASLQIGADFITKQDQYSNDVEKGRIISQTPNAGQVVYLGRTYINFVVSLGAEPTPSTSSSTKTEETSTSTEASTTQTETTDSEATSEE